MKTFFLNLNFKLNLNDVINDNEKYYMHHMIDYKYIKMWYKN